MEKEYKIIKFEDGDFSLDVNVLKEDGSVWLSAMDMSLLFEKNYKSISRIINNIFLEKGLDKDSNSQKMRFTGNDKPTTYFDLKIIVLVGDFINSKRTENFKEWALELSSNNNNKIALVEPIIQFNADGVCLDVTVSPEEDTVWLTQTQICELFDSSKANISEHISNILESKELDFNSVVRNFRTTGADGKTYNIYHYNLDMILSIGYRVNSKRGIMFRHWASNVLKQYLLKGFVVDEKRCFSCTSNINYLLDTVRKLQKQINYLEEFISIDEEKILYEGEILDGYTFLRKLFFLAKKEIIIIDSYADKFLLSMLTDLKVNITIITSYNSYINNVDTNINIIHDNTLHDRFILIDDDIYILGTSFNDLGKKRTVLVKLNHISKEQLLKNII